MCPLPYVLLHCRPKWRRNNAYIHGNVIMKLLIYLSLTDMSFFINEGQEGKTGPVCRLVPVRGRRI
jgi:hypothetical protein